MRNLRPVAACICLTAASSFAQGAPPKPEFEVASVRPAGPEDSPGIFGGPGTSDPGTFTIRALPVRDVLMRAYRLRPFQIAGPPWLNSTRYDITAKVAPGAGREQLDAMLQSLLAERFHLQFHRETRMHSAYELVVSKGGVKLRPSARQPEIPEQNKEFMGLVGARSMWGIVPRRGGIMIVGAAMTVADFASFLESQLDNAPVLDKTGLRGNYDFRVEFAPNDTADASSLPSLFAAVEDTCGLKLQATKASFDTLVVDRVDSPTEN